MIQTMTRTHGFPPRSSRPALAAMLAAMLLLPPALEAQGQATAPDVADSVAPRSSPLAATFNPVPSFERIKSDMDMVGDGLEPLLRLDEELRTLGAQLMAEVKKLGEKQDDPVAASAAARLVTELQSHLIQTISAVLTNSDLIELGIGSANRKLHTLEKYLARTETRFVENAETLGGQIEDARQDALDAVNDYLAYIDALDDPPSRDQRLAAMKLEARVQEKKFRLDLMRLDSRRQQAVANGYANMRRALGKWIDDFNVLKTKTRVMVNQLQAEQDFLARGVQMSVDAARVRQFMENPLTLPDGTSIQAINEKVARIFSMVELFTGIQGRVQESLFGFNLVDIEQDLDRKEKVLVDLKSRALDLKKQIVGS